MNFRCILPSIKANLLQPTVVKFWQNDIDINVSLFLKKLNLFMADFSKVTSDFEFFPKSESYSQNTEIVHLLFFHIFKIPLVW